jgi:hypothetical protein
VTGWLPSRSLHNVGSAHSVGSAHRVGSAVWWRTLFVLNLIDGSGSMQRAVGGRG